MQIEVGYYGRRLSHINFLLVRPKENKRNSGFIDDALFSGKNEWEPHQEFKIRT